MKTPKRLAAALVLVILTAVFVSYSAFHSSQSPVASVLPQSQTAQVSGSSPTVIFLTSGSTWTVPSDWNNSNNTIEVIGGGGGAGAAYSATGGGGGGYSKATNVSLTAGATVGVNVGMGGAVGSSGGGTWVCSSTSGCGSVTDANAIVSANGGGVGGANGVSMSGGAGGTAQVGTGYTGGRGGNTNTNYDSAGGGGAAGPHGNGGNGGSPPTTSTYNGSGGGGNGGGANGVGSTAGGPGAGGNGNLGSGGGTGNGGAGSNGGGGAGSGYGTAGGNGGNGTEWTTVGSGGGGGGDGGDNGHSPGAGGLYGGGGGGNYGYAAPAGGAPGIIVITYTPASGGGNPATYSLTVTNSNTTGGTVTSSPSGISCGTTCSVSGISLGTTYTLTASPNANYNVSWSGCTSSNGNTCSVTVNSNASVTATFASTQSGDNQAPSIPANLTATAVSSSAINLSWNASTDNVGVTGYNVYRCQGSACTPTAISTSNTNNYSDTNLSASTQYTYTVSAYDAAGNTSNQSGSASATTQAASQGNTITAASCSQTDVQTAVNQASTGNIVAIPAGNCTWSSVVSVTKGITVQGAGSDSTVITLNGTQAFAFNVSNSSYRISNIGLTGDVGSAQSGISMDGINTTIRADHLTLTDIDARAILIGYNNWNGAGTQPYGVIDHIKFSNSSSHFAISLYGDNNTWQRPDNLGSAQAIYVEDSTFTGPDTYNSFTDSERGGRFVIRHNTIINSAVMWHDTGSTPIARSTRAYEIYDNAFTCNTGESYGNFFDCGWSAMIFRGGTGVVFGNTIPIFVSNGATGFENASMSEIYRVGEAGGLPWANQCNGSSGDVRSDFMPYSPSTGNICAWSTEYPDCTGICTAGSSGPPGAMCVLLDGNSPNGYPCRDQTGRGIDDPVTHVQTSSPIYWWNNVSPSGSQLPLGIASADSAYIQPNRDYYAYASNFNGTSGVGMGTTANMPTTCTTNVGYWSTDQNVLYKCSSTNTWQADYAPYPYPYPLDASGMPILSEAVNLPSGPTSTPTPTPTPSPTPLPDTTAPTVSITAPANNATVSGSVTLSASATDPTVAGQTTSGIATVQFKLDGVNLGSALTTPTSGSTYSGTWNTAGVSNGSHAITALATDQAGNPTTSSGVTVTVSNQAALTPDITPPSVPTGLTATPVSSSQVNLTWNPSTDPTVNGAVTSGLAGYRIFRNSVQIASISGTSYSDSGLAASTLYSYKVAAFDAAMPANVSSQTAAVSATTQAASIAPNPPPVPSNGSPSTALPSGTTATTLSLSTDIPATCKYATTGNTPYASMTNTFSTTGGTAHSTTVANLSDGTSYAYYVRCQSSQGIPDTGDYDISFSVSSPPAPTGGGTTGGGTTGGGGSSGSSAAPSVGTFTPSVPQAPVSTAAVPNCPSGYSCTPVSVSSCPKGFTCTTSSVPGCPKGFTCALSVSGGGSRASTITKYLYPGLYDAQVILLQKLLNGNGYPVAAYGAGSAGNEINHFGPATTLALEKLQCSTLKLCTGIYLTTGYGATGTTTRAVLNALPNQPVVGAIVASPSSQLQASGSQFTRSLTIGSTGPDVLALQFFLNTHGFIVASTGSGSPGRETDYFGPATRSALARFQATNGITPSVGYFGPITMKAVNALMGR